MGYGKGKEKLGKDNEYRPSSNVKYGSRASRGVRPTSAQARKSGSNLKKKAKRGGTNRTVGAVIKSLHPSLRK